MRRLFRRGSLEGAIQVLILLAVGLMAASASFRHVHDWTMRYSPKGTGSWFGWANAMVTELIPTAAGLEIRRRKHLTGKAGAYPVFLIIGALGLSLVGQFSEAKLSVSGWIVAAIPAVGFGALVKLVISRPARSAKETAAVPAAFVTTTPAESDDDRDSFVEIVQANRFTEVQPIVQPPVRVINGRPPVGSGIVE